MLKIITDVDGVLLDWFNGFEKWITEVKGIKPTHGATPSMYKLTDKYPFTSEEIVKLIEEFNSSSYFGELDAIDGSVEFLKKLVEDDNMEVAWLSAGSVEGQEDKCFDMRSSNLKERFGTDIPGTLLVMDTPKDAYLLRYKEEMGDNLIFIEDSLSHAESAIKLGIRTILLNTTYNNTKTKSKLLYRAKDWEDIYNIIGNIEKDIEYMNTHVSRTGQTAKRWKYLKEKKATNPSYKHISAEVSMIPNPLGEMFPPIPMVTRPGNTYSVGRNKAKREKKAMRRIQNG